MNAARPPFGGEDFTDIEERLRVALTQEARDVEPHERLEDIRAEVDGRSGVGARPRWLMPVGAAAAVVAVAVVAWLGLRPGATPPLPAATSTATASATSSATGSTTSSASPTTSATGTATSTGTGPATGAPPTPPPSSPTSAPPATKDMAVPVYFVSPYGAGKVGLVREYLRTALPGGADGVAQGTVAVNLSLAAQAYVGTDGYLQPWPAGTTARVTAGTNEIQVVLSSAGVKGLTTEQQRVSVQQVVWSATAGLQQNLPVRISVAGGGPLFESMEAGVYKRPAADTAYTDLAPIWIDSPARGQVLPASAAVVVKGLACTFEAGVQWDLTQGGAVVTKGNTTASSGCPTQGSWSVDVGSLPAGDYLFRAYASSPQDGSLVAQKVVSFSVR